MPGSDVVLEHPLGRGGAATIYAARWQGREVSAKVAHDGGAADLDTEARVLARVAHPALLEVLDAGCLPDGRPYLVLPRLRGEDLAARLVRGPLSVARTLAIVRAVGGALTALHDAGVVHRDLKPENVFLADDRVVLLDLGLARELATTTTSLRIRGTYDVMAPERLYGEPASVATEVYELAALAWAMLAGGLPWPAGAAPSARRWMTALAIEDGAALEAVLRGALSTVPERRPASVAALIAALTAAAHDPAASDARRTAEVAPVAREPVSLARPGSVIAETYRLGPVLGSGGAGTVFAAEHVRLPRKLAIKILSPDRDDPDARSRFRREAEIVASLSHPHIVEVFDYDVDDRGAPFMVMPMLEGETLRERLRRGPLPVAMAVELIRQTASAIATAHARGIVHRDLKPSNLFLRAGDRLDVQVLDFGISKVLGDGGDRTATGMILGSPGYAAPEQLRGDTARIGAATDVFALAAIAYEALAGRRAFAGPTRDLVLDQILHAEPPPLPGVARALDRAVRAGLAKRSERRPASAEAFAQALLAASAGAPRSRARRWGAVGAATIALGAAMLVAATRGAPSVAVAASRPPALVASPPAPPVASPVPPVASPPAPPVASPPAPPVASPPSPRAIRLAIQPRGARIEIDRSVVRGDRVTLAPGPHRVRVTAPGYLPATRVVDADTLGDALDVRLIRRATPAPREPELRDLLEK